MFKCRVCEEKEKTIKFLTEQNKDLMDRLMSFTKDAFHVYQAEKKITPDLFPSWIDDKGNPINSKDVHPDKLREDMERALGEDPITVEEEVNI